MAQAVFPDPRRALLQSKLQYPSLSSNTIKRQRLLNQVNSADQTPVILVVAPAGYGKTTLLRGWADLLQAEQWKTAWLTLDNYDNSLLRFWAYLLAAVRLQAPSFQAKAESIFRSQSPILSIASSLVKLLKAFSSISIHSSLTGESRGF
jgi:ATP/maltotriose-dependent transcriptional regulator MalT